ncbi:MAG TPA: glycosyltransferase, partial [Verrucomicrobiota bacterium]|nr:glycosyltransferase [Verrucomicrobiota bacterium]
PAGPRRLSVIIPAFNEEKLLPRTLESLRASLAAFTNAGWETEVIVCDNNSADRTAEVARAHGARVVFEPHNQIARARNTGAAAATGGWLLFLDADCEPSRELLAALEARLRRGGVLYGGAVVALDRPPGLFAAFVAGWNFLSRTLRWMAGSFVCVEAAAFREVGGFSPRMYAGEEIDLSRRLKPLCRAQGKRAFILSRHPLRTSARKLRLYSAGELLRFFLRAVLRPWKTVRSREACSIWYDGRR